MAERCGRRLGELEPWIRGQSAGKSMVFLIWFWSKNMEMYCKWILLIVLFHVFTWCFEFLHDFNSPKISKLSGTAVLNLIGPNPSPASFLPPLSYPLGPLGGWEAGAIHRRVTHYVFWTPCFSSEVTKKEHGKKDHTAVLLLLSFPIAVTISCLNRAVESIPSVHGWATNGHRNSRANHHSATRFKDRAAWHAHAHRETNVHNQWTPVLVIHSPFACRRQKIFNQSLVGFIVVALHGTSWLIRVAPCCSTPDIKW